MTSTINKLIRKEIIFTFRPLFIAIIIVVCMFVQMLKEFSGVWAAVWAPMIFCGAFALSGSVKGYGAKSIGVFVSPITRVEYTKAKYIFTGISAVLAVLIFFAFDILLWQLKNTFLGKFMFIEYTSEGLMIVYPIVIIVIGLAIACLLYSGTCGKINYGVVIFFQMFLSVSFSSLGNKIPYTTMLDFWNSNFAGKPYTYAVYVLVCTMLSAGVIYISYLKCSRTFQKTDL